ncbi:hypothetical protein HDU83_003018 [Entophlyctis luteolus]|nr:hypothetical protein HDU83_003018 [Entophlyctis luteolus]
MDVTVARCSAVQPAETGGNETPLEMQSEMSAGCAMVREDRVRLCKDIGCKGARLQSCISRKGATIAATLKPQMEAIANALKPLEPVYAQLKELLAPLAPIHEKMSQKVFGPFNYYTVAILVFQLVTAVFPSLFSFGSKVEASHILVKEEAKIKELQSILEKSPEKFEDLAKEHSTCPSGKQGGKLGKFSKGQMVPEFDTYCFSPSTNVDVVSPVIKTQFGYHLIKVTAKPT